MPSISPPAEGFTQDRFSYYIPTWKELLAPLVGKPVRALGVAVFEGRCTAWLLDNVLTHPGRNRPGWPGIKLTRPDRATNHEP